MSRLWLASLLAAAAPAQDAPTELQISMKQMAEAISEIEKAIERSDRAALGPPLDTLTRCATALQARTATDQQSVETPTWLAALATAAADLRTAEAPATLAHDFARLRAACTSCHLQGRGDNDARGLFPNRGNAVFGTLRLEALDSAPRDERAARRPRHGAVSLDRRPRTGRPRRAHPCRCRHRLPGPRTDRDPPAARAGRLWLIGVGLVLALLGVAFATRMAARLARPLRQLIDASNRIGAGELSARVGATEDDELGRLAHSFNAMAQTMQQLIADVTDKAARAEAANRAKDGFLTSMSHELRTPLCGIQSTAELLQQFGDQASPEERAEFLATILREAERLGRRISDSLDFAPCRVARRDGRSAASTCCASANRPATASTACRR